MGGDEYPGQTEEIMHSLKSKRDCGTESGSVELVQRLQWKKQWNQAFDFVGEEHSCGAELFWAQRNQTDKAKASLEFCLCFVK